MPPVPVLRAAALLVALAACGRDESGQASGADLASTTPASAAQDADPRVARADSARIMGSPTAPVWVIEVSDFQCPYCRQFHEQTYPALVREYVETGKVRLAFLNFPLGQHPHARPAAEAAMCAGAQGKFWQMHDAIFETQEEWSPLRSSDATFAALGERVGLDMAEQNRCLADDVMLPIIQADYERAGSGGARSTPTFLIGDRKVEGAAPMASFREAIDAALAAAASAPAAGRTP